MVSQRRKRKMQRFFSALIFDNFVFNFNLIQFGTLTKMPRKDLSLAERIALLDQIKGHSPNTSHLAEITGVPKSVIARLIHQQDKLQEEWTHDGKPGTSQKWKCEGKGS
jgi:hypothetical protein